MNLNYDLSNKYSLLQRFINYDMVRIILIMSLVSFFASSCDNVEKVDGKKVISDLAFHKADSIKEYSDLVLRAVKTNRDKVVLSELKDFDIDPDELNRIISGYSQSIGSKDWDFSDVESDAETKDLSDGIDYNWHDKRGRIAIQINVKVEPKDSGNGYKLNKIEFRSRLDILPSFSFPGGEIPDYKKMADKK